MAHRDIFRVVAMYSVMTPDGEDWSATEEEVREFVREYRDEHGEDALARVVIHALDAPIGEPGAGQRIDPRSLL
jgi:hypothetical protein